MEIDVVRTLAGGYAVGIRQYDLVVRFSVLGVENKVEMPFLPEMQQDDIVKRLRRLADVIESPEKY